MKSSSHDPLLPHRSALTPESRKRKSGKKKLKPLDEFTRGYAVCALWSSTDESNEQGGNPLDDNYGIEDISRECLLQMQKDCEDFQEAEAKNLSVARDEGEDSGRAGHDFWLTRNRHGAGFWDRGLSVGDALTKAAHAYGETNLYVHRGKIHCG